MRFRLWTSSALFVLSGLADRLRRFGRADGGCCRCDQTWAQTLGQDSASTL